MGLALNFIYKIKKEKVFVADPSFSKVSSMHMYAWKKGLKTGCYYLRTKAVATAQKFTIEPGKKPDAGQNAEQKVLACSIDNPDCEACSA